MTRDKYDEMAEGLVDKWTAARTPAPSLSKRIAAFGRSAASEARAKAIEECRSACKAIADKDDEYCGSVSMYDADACVAAVSALSAQDKEQPPHVAADDNDNNEGDSK